MATSADAGPSSVGGPGTGNEAWDRSKAAFTSKRSSEFLDPCQEAANKSIRCMHRNRGDRDLCQDYFQAYRDCKKEWTERRRRSSWMPDVKPGSS